MRRSLIVALGSALAMATVLPGFAQAQELRPLNGSPNNGTGGARPSAPPNYGVPGAPGGGGGGPGRFGGGGRGPGGFGGGGPGRVGGNPGFRGGNGGDGFRHHGHHGGGLAAGAAGLAAGALIGGAIASQNYGYNSGYGYGYGDPGYYDAPTVVAPDEDQAPADAVAYCEQRYRSYDPQSGTFLGYDGQRHPCP